MTNELTKSQKLSENEILTLLLYAGSRQSNPVKVRELSTKLLEAKRAGKVNGDFSMRRAPDGYYSEDVAAHLNWFRSGVGLDINSQEGKEKLKGWADEILKEHGKEAQQALDAFKEPKKSRIGALMSMLRSIKSANRSTEVDIGTLILGVVKEKGSMFSIEATEALLELKKAREISFESIITKPGSFGNSDRVQQVMAVFEVRGFLKQEYGEAATITPRGSAWLDNKLHEYFHDRSERQRIVELMQAAVR